MRVVRIRGGLKERLRFFHLTDPAITRKRSIEGVALKSDAKTRVVSSSRSAWSCRSTTSRPARATSSPTASSATTASRARRTSTWTSTRREDFEREIVVKVNVPEVLRAELARPSWKGEPVALGTNTDPYQWVEGRYKLMRGIWEALRDAANPCSILTKSPLRAARPRPAEGDRGGRGRQRVPVGADAGREGVARDRAAHAEPARAAGGGGGAQPRRHPDRDPDRAADARDQRRAGAGRADRRARDGGRRASTSAATRCSCAGRCGRSSSTGCASTGPT